MKKLKMRDFERIRVKDGRDVIFKERMPRKKKKALLKKLIETNEMFNRLFEDL